MRYHGDGDGANASDLRGLFLDAIGALRRARKTLFDGRVEHPDCELILRASEDAEDLLGGIGGEAPTIAHGRLAMSCVWLLRAVAPYIARDGWAGLSARCLALADELASAVDGSDEP